MHLDEPHNHLGYFKAVFFCCFSLTLILAKWQRNLFCQFIYCLLVSFVLDKDLHLLNSLQVAALEAAAARQTGRLVSLSLQNILDCTKRWGTDPCVDGGFITWAFNYVQYNQGLASQKDYPYTGAYGKICQNRGRQNGTQVFSITYIRNEADMKVSCYIVINTLIAILEN